jgi:hypothetical protein
MKHRRDDTSYELEAAESKNYTRGRRCNVATAMDSDASYGDAGEAFSFGLGTPAGAGMAKKTRAVRRGSKRTRQETEADEIRIRTPLVFNSAGRISNAELLRAIVEEPKYRSPDQAVLLP